MAIATVTLDDADPDFQFTTKAEMDNTHIAEMLWSVRRRNPNRRPPILDADGKPVLDENNQPTFHELTNQQALAIMLGQMLAGWSSNASLDRAEEARQAVQPAAPGRWTVIA